MPVNIPDTLPAAEVLKNENIFIMNQSRAVSQDIRPLRIGILNLMPNKEITETQLIRMLSNSPLQVELILLYTKTHISKNTSAAHLTEFYHSFDEYKHQKLDGLIITGAPVEHLQFEKITYWKELTQILDWAQENVTSCFFICWGAQAALYHHYGIQKYNLPHKMFGIFNHSVNKPNEPLLTGFDDEFYAPHSRNTYTRREDIVAQPELELLSESHEAGVYICASKDKKQVFVSGHSEYDRFTLRDEFVRDTKKGIDIALPEHYFPNNDPSQTPVNLWKSHGNLLFSNWLNYYVYQETPYNL
ncbi:MAG: homoserine O-succinyltransferase [Bacteroidales bacterium]|jgi:homoserine O-succinyltransferase|nr:homoserine O-succinyltransferase [Bacteroidales bacterium]